MAYSESGEQLVPVEGESAVVADDQQTRTPPSRTQKSRQNRWLAISGIGLLMLGLGFGWRFFQAGRSGAPQAGMGPGGGIPVKLETTKTSLVQDTSEYVGSLDSRRSVVLQPEIAGRVSDIYVRPGERVSAGEPIVQIKPEEQQAQLAGNLAAVNSSRAARSNALSQVQAQEANRIAKQAEVELQNDEYKRISDLVREGALPQQQLDRVKRDRARAVSELRAIDQQIQAARASLSEAEADLQEAQANAAVTTEQLRRTTITAPFDGIVGDIPIKLGQLVSSSDTLTTVTQNDVLEIKLQVPLEKAPELRQGLQVQLTSTQGNVLSTGRISFVSPQADNRAQSILARASFDNAAGRLRDGQFVRARIIWQQRPGVLIPSSAISRLGGETFVFVAQPMDETCKEAMSKMPQAAAPKDQPPGEMPSLVARQRLVKLGAIQGNSYHVLSGLKPNEQIVASGILNLAECAPIVPQTQTSAAR